MSSEWWGGQCEWLVGAAIAATVMDSASDTVVKRVLRARKGLESFCRAPAPLAVRAVLEGVYPSHCVSACKLASG